ncbi:MAG: methyltransferase [Henriciella sp.]|uniref:methyltransferase n=1 Tax=Henriciella sp. TaxID=1968823 RepID=UPI003C77F6E6
MLKPSASPLNTLSKTSPERAAARKASLLDRLKDARSALYASPGFQTFCSGFWPTRFVARSKAAGVFDLCAGFVYSQILFACVRLELLPVLKVQSLTLREIANHCGLPQDGAARLVKGAAALGILEARSGGRYGLGSVGAAVLGNPGLQGMIAHHDHLYSDMTDPAALLENRSKSTALAQYWIYSPSPSDMDADRAVKETYSNLMRDTQLAVAAEVLRAYSFARHERLLDVGGGDGTFLRMAAEDAPGLDLSLFELPAVAELAQERLEDAGISADVHAGNMFEEDWPDGADLITLIRVCLDHDDDRVATLLSRARKALKPGGVLLIGEPMADSPKVGDAYFGFYLWAMGSGRARTSSEIRQMLDQAGFSETRVLKTGLPDLVRVIRAS